MLLSRWFDRLYNFCVLKANKVQYGPNLKINGRINIHNAGSCIIGRDVVINSSLKHNPIGGDPKTIIIVHRGASLSIGDDVGLSNSTLYCTQEIVIADHVAIGGSCRIYDTDFHSIYYEDRCMAGNVNIPKAPIHINRGSWLGANVTVLKGASIGEKSVIGAGSIVTHAVPPNQVWAGNPSRFIKDIKQ